MPPLATHALPAHEPVLVNLLGHAAGALLFGIFLTLALRDRAGRTIPGFRLSFGAAACALIWNLASLAVLAAPAAPWAGAVLAAGASALSLLPALLFHLSLGRRLHALVRTGYALSLGVVSLHLAEPWLAGAETHGVALLITAAGFAALTLSAAFALWRGPEAARPQWSSLAGALPLFLFALTFVHFRAGGAHSAWSLEMAVHHAGIPLALFVLLRDYRFVLLDAFLRFLVNFLLAALFSLGAYRLHLELEAWPAHPAADALALVLFALLLIAFALVRGVLQRALTRLWFRAGDPQALLARLAGAGELDAPDAYLAWAEREIAAFFNAEPALPHAPAELLAPVHLAAGETRHLSLGRRRGGRRYLSEDLDLLARFAAAVSSEIARRREAELRRLAMQAELRALQAQIHPHFLFNALNALYGLIPKQAEGARRTVLNLADMLRYFLRSGADTIALAEEMKIVAAYLEIEQLRLGPKLKVEIDVAPEAAPALIPALSVQPLVENAVRHGVAPLEEGGVVRIHAAFADGAVEVEVADTGRGFTKDVAGAGVGLENVRRRLRLVHGEAADPLIESSAAGTRIRFRVPASG